MAGHITPIVMPKWGLEMREGTVQDWLVKEGERIEVGEALVDVDTDKISNAVEAADTGFSRRFFSAALERELLLRPIGNTVYFMPPYVIGADECELLVSRTHQALDAVLD